MRKCLVLVCVWTDKIRARLQVVACRLIGNDAKAPLSLWDAYSVQMVAELVLLQDLGWALLEREYIIK